MADLIKINEKKLRRRGQEKPIGFDPAAIPQATYIDRSNYKRRAPFSLSSPTL